MHQEQVFLAAAQVGRDLWCHPLDEVHQVVPVLARPIRPVCLLDDIPLDFQCLGLLAKCIEEQVIEGDSFQAETSLIAPPRTAASGWDGR